MDNQKLFQQVLELLGQYKKPRSLEWLIDFIRKDIIKKNIASTKYKEYFSANKEKIYKYHEQYRKDHPEYEEKRRERARKKQPLNGQ